MTISKKRVEFISRLVNAMYYSKIQNASYYMSQMIHGLLDNVDANELVKISDNLREISVSHEWIANMARAIKMEELG